MKVKQKKLDFASSSCVLPTSLQVSSPLMCGKYGSFSNCQIKQPKGNGQQMATITTEKSQEITAAFGANAKDTGSARVQIAILTEKIKNLTEHAKSHRKDFHSLRGLTAMVAKRKNLLKFYSKQDLEGYRALIKELGLRG